MYRDLAARLMGTFPRNTCLYSQRIGSPEFLSTVEKCEIVLTSVTTTHRIVALGSGGASKRLYLENILADAANG